MLDGYEGPRQMAIAGLIAHLVPTGGGGWTLDWVARRHRDDSGSHLRGQHFSLYLVGLAAVLFLIASWKPTGTEVASRRPWTRRTHALVFSGFGVFVLIIALLFWVGVFW
jgi:hypothetical protein